MKAKSIFLIIVAVVIVLVFASAYVVDETEQVVVTQFGRGCRQSENRSRSLF